MDDLIAEFLTETTESLGELDTDLIKLEQNPNDIDLLSNIFRLMHTIKGTCGFLGLPRLEKVAHHAENVLGRFRDGDLEVKPAYVTLILESIDQIKFIIGAIEETGAEPEGNDDDLIKLLDAVYEGKESLDPNENTEAPAEETEEVSAEPSPPAEEETQAPTNEKQQDLDNKVEAAKKQLEAEKKIKDAQDKAIAKQAGNKPGAKPADKETSVANQSLRVNVEVLENLMTMVSELVLTRNQLLQILRTQTDSDFTAPLQRLNHVVSDLQEGVMKTRMQPIGNAWAKLPRIVRDITMEVGKKIDLQMLGQETELDRQVLELIKDPLTHMVRNSADHGVEMPEDRIAAGKPETGKVILNAYHEGGHIIIEIKDDGKGLSTEKIRTKIIEKELATEEELDSMTDQQIHMFIFKAGFSTAEQVTNLSGRGVGMDVVRTNIEKIGGSIDLKSIEGEGSTFKIKIPLTLAIVSALIIEAGKERFAIPQLAVRELVMAGIDGENKIEMIKGSPVFRLRDSLLPLVCLKDLLKLDDVKALPQEDPEPAISDLENVETDQNDEKQSEETIEIAPEVVTEEKKSQYIIVTQVGTYSFGIMVDRVFDTEEIVVKPVAQIIRDIELFSGNTILGDGSVIMILDPNGIAKATGEAAGSDKDTSSEEQDEAHHSGREKTSLLVFAAGGGAPKTVPLSLVARLEMIKTENVEHANGQDLIQYRGQLMPIVPLSGDINLKDRKECPLLVFTDNDRVMGLAVDEIIDIKEEVVNVQLDGSKDGLIGTAIIDDKATDVIDVGHYIRSVRNDWFQNHDDKPYTKEGSNFSDNEEATRQKRILLVDDSPFFRNMLTPVLSMAGYQVTALDNAGDALKRCQDGEMFDLIISDIEMPEIDGFEFIQKIKENENWSETPVLALSSHATEKDIERGKQAGFTDHIAKFDRDNLLSTLNKTLSLGDALESLDLPSEQKAI